MGLANTALLMSVIRGLMSRGLIDQAEARLWLNNVAALIEEDKTAFTKKAGAKLSPLSDRLVRLLNLNLSIFLISQSQGVTSGPPAAGKLCAVRTVAIDAFLLAKGHELIGADQHW